MTAAVIVGIIIGLLLHTWPGHARGMGWREYRRRYGRKER